MMKKLLLTGSGVLVAAAIISFYLLGLYHGRTGEGLTIGNEAVAAQTNSSVSPIKALKERDVYYPGSEDLAPDEMRVIACGTGMPNARPKQAAACWIVELGNGDKFIFDIGLGSAERISAMKIPYDYLDKLFIGHLHADHIGDIDALWIGGVISNRQRPLRVFRFCRPARVLSISAKTKAGGCKNLVTFFKVFYIFAYRFNFPG